MIEHFRVRNYKALKDVSLALTPIHVLIGPNNTGKTSILEAVTALSRSVEFPLETAFTGPWQGSELVWNHHAELPVVLGASVRDTKRAAFDYEVSCRFPFSGRGVIVEGERFQSEGENTELPGSNSTSTAVQRALITSTFPESTRRIASAVVAMDFPSHTTIGGTRDSCRCRLRLARYEISAWNCLALGW